MWGQKDKGSETAEQTYGKMDAGRGRKLNG